MRLTRHIIILLILHSSLFTLHSSLLTAQVYHPVKWTFSTKQLKNNEAELILTAKIENSWYLYSQDVPKGGPIPTSFKFNPSDDYKLIGKVKEQEPEVKNDENFDMKLKVFHNSAEFKQKVKILSVKNFSVKGTLEFMCCNNKQCLPPDEVDYTFDLPGGSGITQNDNNKPQASLSKPESGIKNPQSTGDNLQSAINNNKSENNLSQSPEINPQAATENNTQTTIQNQQSQVDNPQSIPINRNNPKSSEGSLWSFFIIALIAGFAGTLTPCVFPMIPATVSFFLNMQGNKGKSVISVIIYGLSIIFIYTAIGLIVSLLKSDPDTINRISSHWITNMLFFGLFVAFAASFFGVFEITLPSGLTTKTDKQVDKGGYLAAFFLALTLVLASFACTGPIVGAILIEATGGYVLRPVIGMFGFGLAFSIPFIILALFPSLLGNLPKSGGWLNSVKVVMAFIILAFSLKFFGSADEAYHWNILSREAFIAIWIVLFTLMGFYLLGKIKFKLDSALPYISFFRIILVIITFSFVVYLIPGLFGANLKLISGFIPYESTSTSGINNLNGTNNLSTINHQPSTNLCEKPKYTDILHLPYNLEGYFDYKQALECSRKTNKPMFIAFTGHSCGNCHKMENDVWSDPEVLKRLMNDYVVVMLYTDDRTELPASECITSTYDGKIKNTIGKLNADLRLTRYNSNIQPYYVLLGTDEKLLTQPMAYDLNVDHFVKFLDAGINQFKSQSPKA